MSFQVRWFDFRFRVAYAVATFLIRRPLRLQIKTRQGTRSVIYHRA